MALNEFWSNYSKNKWSADEIAQEWGDNPTNVSNWNIYQKEAESRNSGNSSRTWKQAHGINSTTSSSNSSLSSLYSDYYKTTMDNLNASYQKQLDTLSGLNDQGLQDIQNQYAAQSANVQQDMTSRGLTGTTISGTMSNAVNQQNVAAQNNYKNQLAQMKMGVESQYGMATAEYPYKYAALNANKGNGFSGSLHIGGSYGGNGNGQGDNGMPKKPIRYFGLGGGLTSAQENENAALTGRSVPNWSYANGSGYDYSAIDQALGYSGGSYAY